MVYVQSTNYRNFIILYHSSAQKHVCKTCCHECKKHDDTCERHAGTHRTLVMQSILMHALDVPDEMVTYKNWVIEDIVNMRSRSTMASNCQSCAGTQKKFNSECCINFTCYIQRTDKNCMSLFVSSAFICEDKFLGKMRSWRSSCCVAFLYSRWNLKWTEHCWHGMRNVVTKV